jgi:AcrR family transcriptional regulator
VSSQEATRRASYGPTSPLVGKRGARTRALITDVALLLLADRQAQELTVDDIARAAGISRAAVYQYFESKDHVYAELAERSGGALLRTLRQVGPFGPDRAGFAQVTRWVTAWTAIYHRYADVFAQWPAIGSTFTAAVPMVGAWLGNYLEHAVPLLPDDGSPGAEQLALAVWALFERYNLFERAGGDEAQTAAQLAIVVQQMLFPETPPAVLDLDRLSPQRTDELRPAPRAAPTPLPTDEGGTATARKGRLSSVAGPTAARLLDAAARVFTATGFRVASVDQVVSAAGVGRGTFYKYFDDKLDVLGVLSVEGAAEMEALAARLDVLVSSGSSGRLEPWLADFLRFHSKYGVVWRVWTDDPGLAGRLPEPGVQARRALDGALSRLIASGGRPSPVDPRALMAMLAGLLQRFPDQAAGTVHHLPPTLAEGVLDQLIRRAALAPD